MSFTVRRVEAGEWERVRELRLRSLQDPVAALAFLDTFENASAQPDEFWRQRTANAAPGGPNAQYVAIAEDGEWFGSATVIPSQTSAGRATALVVGVYVADGHRGAGVIEVLFDECAAWAADHGYTELTLEVHVDNHRAQAAYERCGFTRTGEITELANGREYVMARPVVPVLR
ncbi:Protein N-acetyltransferase, RimJ/RimL family [Microbacterium sp. 8M]|uniref:GNAT family N-acetyltransferase n=1 Tax=Microbacterium sp. 8M TaxID=2653153 RepID=UPI0012F32257|nr:GNAT family N-acetyltransferase [Microbacterium sp. 8M]VXC19372.1 Protein N-acetyltransferase, RimJ/RimL family [Microbacterium sp. 8M]